jgi:prepilin-type N-terminal cleavage/methylation domain-containing protein
MNFRGLRARACRRGFTLTEMLVVIAVIALLAAMLFPVLKGARDNARKGNCSTNLHQMLQGVNMYKDDWRVYPDALFGFEPAVPGGNCAAGNPERPSQPRLWPEYVKDRKAFNCPNAPIDRILKTDSGATYDAMNEMTGVQHVDNTANPSFMYCYYGFSSYDFQFKSNGQQWANSRRQTHYALKWTPSPQFQGLQDERRQLVYRNPPDSTVVTWCMYHSNLDSSGNPKQDGLALVAYLSGRVQEQPATRMASWPPECLQPPNGFPPANCPWQIQPKP